MSTAILKDKNSKNIRYVLTDCVQAGNFLKGKYNGLSKKIRISANSYDIEWTETTNLMLNTNELKTSKGYSKVDCLHENCFDNEQISRLLGVLRKLKKKDFETLTSQEKDILLDSISTLLEYLISKISQKIDI